MRRWALKAVRFVLIASLAIVVAGLVASVFKGLNPVNFMNMMIAVMINVLILFSLKQKDYLFTDGAAKPKHEARQRLCEHCGYEGLTSFDRICPKCRRET